MRRLEKKVWGWLQVPFLSFTERWREWAALCRYGMVITAILTLFSSPQLERAHLCSLLPVYTKEIVMYIERGNSKCRTNQNPCPYFTLPPMAYGDQLKIRAWILGPPCTQGAQRGPPLFDCTPLLYTWCGNGNAATPTSCTQIRGQNWDISNFVSLPPWATDGSTVWCAVGLWLWNSDFQKSQIREDCYPTFWILFLTDHQGPAEFIWWLCCTNVNVP